jgi:hypothetical protein
LAFIHLDFNHVFPKLAAMKDLFQNKVLSDYLSSLLNGELTDFLQATAEPTTIRINLLKTTTAGF